MGLIELLVGLILCSVALSWVARQLHVPYAVALLIGGFAISFVPELPRIKLDPELILAVFLPPVLYQAALFTSWRDFKRYSRPITTLAIGLVLATTVAVGVVLHWLVPGLPWAAAFALGAIVSPPDAVAATAILGPLHMPRGLVAVLEGESLVNDASGLVLYKMAVAAVVTGTFTWHGKGIEFLWIAAGGIALGVALGRLFVEVQRRLGDTMVEVLFALTLPYTAYLAAEGLGVSGVLAVVAAGLVRARYTADIISPETRLLTLNLWNVVVFLFNSLIFIMIGLELPSVIANLTHIPTENLILYAAAIVGTAVAVRLFWVFPLASLSRLPLRVFERHDRREPWQAKVVVGWCGMRGIVSMAAALALPHFTAQGTPFPERHLLIFLTFATIAATLLLQGLTLAPLIRWLKIAKDNGPEEEERQARMQMSHAALAEINRLAVAGNLDDDSIRTLRALYSVRLEHLDPPTSGSPQRPVDMTALQVEAVRAERHQLIRLWREGTVGDDVRRTLERELDLEDARLAQQMAGD
jgi:CPA1 family monovalent cation:H+ antiporter